MIIFLFIDPKMFRVIGFATAKTITGLLCVSKANLIMPCGWFRNGAENVQKRNKIGRWYVQKGNKIRTKCGTKIVTVRKMYVLVVQNMCVIFGQDTQYKCAGFAAERGNVSGDLYISEDSWSGLTPNVRVVLYISEEEESAHIYQRGDILVEGIYQERL